MIDQNQEILNEFLDRMTINVSEFYRNAKRWEVLEKKIFPQIIQHNKSLKYGVLLVQQVKNHIRLAMIFSKFIPLVKLNILATDIDENALARANRYLSGTFLK